jgi:hypothetical protein
LFSGVNVKTGELFPATFPDKGPDQALRSARHLTGGQQVMFLPIIFVYHFTYFEEGRLISLELTCLDSIQDYLEVYIQSVTLLNACEQFMTFDSCLSYGATYEHWI